MHWLTRATIAVGAGFVIGPFLLAGAYLVLHPGRAWPENTLLWAFEEMAEAWFVFVPMLLLAVTVFGLLTKYVGPRPLDKETRCRKCGYILRGITEPRCSECGERI